MIIVHHRILKFINLVKLQQESEMKCLKAGGSFFLFFQRKIIIFYVLQQDGILDKWSLD